MILGIDTSIGTAVALVDAAGTVRAELGQADTRGHAEAIGTLLHAVLEAAGAAPGDITAVAVGMGPGPFTGLRVGIAAARAFATALGVPLLPVVSHSALALEQAEAGGRGLLVVATDARRREHYWSVHELDAGGAVLVAGPGLTALEDLDAVAGVAAATPRCLPSTVSAAAVARLAQRRRAAGAPAGPEQPLYLREPDVTVSKGPKRVTG